MRIAYFILNSFDIDSRARLEVAGLRGCGHQVDVIATAGAPSGEYSGARIYRISQWRHPTRKFRFLQYNLFAARIAARLKPDICHAVDLDTLLAADRAARKTGARLIYEARELYTELEALGGRPAVRRAWEALERRLIGRAQRVITIDDSIADELRRRYGIDRPAVIRNAAPRPGPLTPVDLRREFDVPHDWKVIVYQGVLRRGQGLHYALEIAARLEKIALIFIGDGVIKAELEDLVDRAGLADRVRFAGRIEPDRLLSYTAGADAGLLLMEDVALNNRLALPQKLFQYLVAGAPQIVSPMPEIAGFVTREATGIVVPPADPARAAADISAFLFDPAAHSAAVSACRRSAERNNWEFEERKLLNIYRELESHD